MVPDRLERRKNEFPNKLMDSMRLSEDSDDDYFLDDDYEDDDKPAKKGLFKKDSYEDDYDEPEVQKPRFLPRATSNNKVVPMRRGDGGFPDQANIPGGRQRDL